MRLSKFFTAGAVIAASIFPSILFANTIITTTGAEPDQGTLAALKQLAMQDQTISMPQLPHV